MRYLYYIATLFTVLILSSCEDLIELDIKGVDPQVVIVGDLNNMLAQHEISIHKSVALTESLGSSAVSNAQVSVISEGDQQTYPFTYKGEGIYENSKLQLRVGRSYLLKVQLDGKSYEARSTVPAYVEVDSLNLKTKTFFNEEKIFISFSFQDPAEKANYFKYNIQRNQKPLHFASVYSDKYNDGLYVEHEITDPDEDIMAGDEIKIVRTCIDVSVYNYWSDIQNLNPGSLAPANPRSNISNGALGYFSAGSAREYYINSLKL